TIGALFHRVVGVEHHSVNKRTVFNAAGCIKTATGVALALAVKDDAAFRIILVDLGGVGVHMAPFATHGQMHFLLGVAEDITTLEPLGPGERHDAFLQGVLIHGAGGIAA